VRGVAPVVCDWSRRCDAIARINDVLVSQNIVAPSSVIVVVSISPTCHTVRRIS